MAKKKQQPTSEELALLERRITILEMMLAAHGYPGRFLFPGMMVMRPWESLPGDEEYPISPWKHLVARSHPWKRQLFLKGRNLTARQLVGAVKANKLTLPEAAENWGVPEEAIDEALRYATENVELLEMEAAVERYIAAQGVKHRGPRSAS